MGEVFLPKLGKHVPWEGIGERALLILADRRFPDLQNIVSQPETFSLTIDGKRVRYTPDYEAFVRHRRPALWEVKGDQQLKEERVQKKLAAAAIAANECGKTFEVFNSRQLTSSIELQNVLVLRRYALQPVTLEQSDSVLSAFRHTSHIPLGALVKQGAVQGITREQVYGLLYRGILDHDWLELKITESSLSRRGTDHAYIHV